MKKLKSTVYHRMCNGLLEKYNSTWEEGDPGTWDDYVPALMFAYCEVPNECIGFSPFELLHGHHVHGPLALMK